MKRDLLFSLTGLVMGFVVTAIVVSCLGENPLLVFEVLARGAFGSWSGWAYSLYYATPLIFTGLAVSWAFQAGLFNIGAEGQMALGGLAMLATGLALPNLPPLLAIALASLTAFFAGGIWGALSGVLKAYRGIHEVLGTIMLNFVAYGIVGYCVSETFRNLEAQSPETKSLSEAYRLPVFLNDPLNWSFVIALFAAVVVAIILWRTRFGFIQRMTGSGSQVGRFAGHDMKKQLVISMFVSGGLAGLAALPEILGFSLKLREGFTAGAGFIGIAVALLARNSPIGVIFAGVLFGALHKGSLDLDLDTEKVSRDLAVVVQAIIIIFVAAHRGLDEFTRRFTKGRRRA
jgi:simple sugar transport system permease protein